MIVIFAGPTICHSEIQQHLDCVCLPPIGHGDILKLLPKLPEAIGIIDGYFEGVPSVWHKEILYAMDQGVHVYGCSSMGALRAAELHQMGMTGIGQIFEWYRDDLIEDDDEVAVLHGPEEVGFLVASEPMVNIRATLNLAQLEGVISIETKITLLTNAKSIFYKKRSWRALLALSTDIFSDKATKEKLKIWLDINRIDLKKQDALQMLNLMQQQQPRHCQPFNSSYHFEWTNVWDEAFYQHTHQNGNSSHLSETDQNVLDQLRLDPDLYQHYREKALLSWIANNQVDASTDDNKLQSALKQFRAKNHLDSRAQLLSYMVKVSLDETTLTQLLEGVSRVNSIRETAGDLGVIIIDQLKLCGHYADLMESAKLKLAAIELPDGANNLGVALPPMLSAWYFTRRLNRAIPKQLNHHLKLIDLDNADDFYRLIHKEYIYWQVSNRDNIVKE
jgi:hypothetical protein